MMTRYLIRATLRRDASVAALAPVLVPEGDNARIATAHRLVWSLLPADASASRDFLWREESPGRFMLLSARPAEPSALFDIQCREFAPNLAINDRLHFVLRANPTVAQRQPGQRGLRHDVVMHALHPLARKPAEDRAEQRAGLTVAAGTAWLELQAKAAGFELDPLAIRVESYRQLRLPRDGARPIRFSTIDYAGTLKVTDPAVFLARLARGFGRARAFGCGLMLIRRALPAT